MILTFINLPFASVWPAEILALYNPCMNDISVYHSLLYFHIVELLALAYVYYPKNIYISIGTQSYGNIP